MRIPIFARATRAYAHFIFIHASRANVMVAPRVLHFSAFIACISTMVVNVPVHVHDFCMSTSIKVLIHLLKIKCVS